MKGWISTTNPPKELKLSDMSIKAKAKAAKAEATPLELQPPAPPTMGFLGYPYPFTPYGPPSHMPPWGPGYGMHAIVSSSKLPPSSPSAEDVEDVTLFPRISQWLHDLDNGPYGDGHNFSAWVEYFAEQKYMRICDIADGMSSLELSKSSGMAEGTAKCLVSYTEADTWAICKREKRHAQVEKVQPRHYT